MSFTWLSAIPTPPDFLPSGTLDDVVPSVRPKFVELLAYAKSQGMNPQIRSAGRTCEQQQEQVRLGFSQADLCRSLHVLGHAIDVNLTPNACTTYTKLGEWWESQGGVWGGHWKQFGPCGDAGHFMYGFGGAGAVPTSVCPSGVTLAECKRVRSDYLTKAFAGGAPGISSGGGIGAGVLIAGAAVALLVATLSVRGR